MIGEVWAFLAVENAVLRLLIGLDKQWDVLWLDASCRSGRLGLGYPWPGRSVFRHW